MSQKVLAALASAPTVTDAAGDEPASSSAADSEVAAEATDPTVEVPYAPLPSGWNIWRSWHTAFFHYGPPQQGGSSSLPAPRGVQFAAFPFQRLKDDPRRCQKGAGRRRCACHRVHADGLPEMRVFMCDLLWIERFLLLSSSLRLIPPLHPCFLPV